MQALAHDDTFCLTLAPVRAITRRPWLLPPREIGFGGCRTSNSFSSFGRTTRGGSALRRFNSADAARNVRLAIFVFFCGLRILRFARLQLKPWV